jgi:hypothetical protein
MDMDAMDQIDKDIVDMGYVFPKVAVVPQANYYKLKDGTVIRVIMILNYLTPVSGNEEDFDVNTTNIISCFAPSSERRPDLFTPVSASDLNKGIVDEDVEFDTVKENFTTYNLTNGLTVSIKPVLAQARKTKYYTAHGEPVYLTNISPIVKFKTSKN